MKGALALAAIVCALAVGAGPAAAQEEFFDRQSRRAREYREAQEARDPRHFELHWTIGPHEMPSGDFWVAKRGEIVETRLLPAGLYVAERPVVAADGTLLMAAGQQMVKLRARQLAACNLRTGPGGRSAVMRVCLVDSDNDGSFDSYFERNSDNRFWFAFRGRLAERPKPLATPAIRLLPPEEMTEAPILGLHFSRVLDGGLTIPITLHGDGRDLASFYFTLRTGGRTDTMDRACQSPILPSFCTSSIFPSQFRFAGLTLDLLERRGEDIRVRMVTPFERAGVRIVDTPIPPNFAKITELFLVEDR